MAVFQITFSPSGPYFFGDEKGFAFADGKNGEYGKLYYIKGENTPLQTTILGAIRYLLLPEKTFAAAADAAHLIGKESFDPGSDHLLSFGAIKRLSALFLCKGREWFVPTPFDHNEACARQEQGKTFYTPFASYAVMETLDGVKLYTPDYDPKLGITCGYMSLSDAHVENGLFSAVTRAGLNCGTNQDGYFKKDFVALQPGFSFSVLAEIDETVATLPARSVVRMGQNKVPFSVEVTKQDFGTEEVCRRAQAVIAGCRKHVRYPDGKNYRFVYAPADVLPEGYDTQDLYSGCAFAVTKFRHLRNLKTKAFNGAARFEKSTTLNRLLRGGSIFVVEQGNHLSCLTDRQSLRIANATLIGCNGLVWEKENAYENNTL